MIQFDTFTLKHHSSSSLCTEYFVTDNDLWPHCRRKTKKKFLPKRMKSLSYHKYKWQTLSCTHFFLDKLHLLHSCLKRLPSYHLLVMRVEISSLFATVLCPPAGSLWAGLSPPPYWVMESVTLDASVPYKHLFLRVTAGSQYEKRVIVFRLRLRR